MEKEQRGSISQPPRPLRRDCTAATATLGRSYAITHSPTHTKTMQHELPTQTHVSTGGAREHEGEGRRDGQRVEAKGGS